MQTLRSRQAVFPDSRFDPKLVHLDVPRVDGREAAEERVAECEPTKCGIKC